MTVANDNTDVATYHIAGGIPWDRFNRPKKLNCMRPNLNRLMGWILDALEDRDDFGVLVPTGEGAAWSAGMDLGECFRENENRGLGTMRPAQRKAYGWRRLRWYDKPTIAMVNERCFGGRYDPLFACDLAIAADEAQFPLSEINWGILPGGDATKDVVDLIPMRDAMNHALTGELIDNKKAAEWRLVDKSLPLADLETRVRTLAATLLKKNPVALEATKDAVRRSRR